MAGATIQGYNYSYSFDAPLDFVFEWCTDYRKDDGKMTGSRTKSTFLEKTRERVVWIVNYEKEGKEKEGIRVVWLQPPNAWHLDTCGDTREVGDYRLTAISKNKTRLDMAFEVTFEEGEKVQSQEDREKEAFEGWSVYKRCLEEEYAQT